MKHTQLEGHQLTFTNRYVIEATIRVLDPQCACHVMCECCSEYVLSHHNHFLYVCMPCPTPPPPYAGLCDKDVWSFAATQIGSAGLPAGVTPQAVGAFLASQCKIPNYGAGGC
jgi:hypothetical protein